MQIKTWCIRQLGGYATIEEALEAAPQKTLNKAVARLFCYVTKDDILTISGTRVFYKNNELTEGEVKALCEEAMYFSKTHLFKMLQEEMKYQATKKMYLESQTIHDLTWGKLLLYTSDILKSKINDLIKLRDRL